MSLTPLYIPLQTLSKRFITLVKPASTQNESNQVIFPISHTQCHHTSYGMTSYEHTMASFEHAITSDELTMTSYEHTLASFEHAITADELTMTSFERTMTSDERTMASELQNSNFNPNNRQLLHDNFYYKNDQTF